MAHQVHCPDLSKDAEVSGVIATWFAQDKQTVQQGQVIAEIAVDKVTMDVEAPATGVIHLLVAEESEVTSGQLIAEIH